MTLENLFEVFENYYGVYENQYVKSSVVAYIKKDHKPTMYPEIKRAVQYFHPANYSAPCIAVIEKSLKAARIEKGLTDTHKTKTTDTTKYNYRESNDPDFDKVNVDLKEMLKDKIKKVGE